MTPVWLGLIGLALALPAPALLARAAWPRHSPATAIVLWQSVALAAVLAISGAALSTALWLVTSQLTWWRIALHVLILAIGVLVWARFWWAAWQVWRQTAERRRRNAELVDLLSEPHGNAQNLWPAVRILAEQTPVAYCIPSWRDARVVISQGTLDTLDAASLAAVLEHERAHVRSRHDLVLEAFGVLHRAFPRPLRTDAPLRQSQLLVELMADDAARRSTGDPALARAIVALAGGPTPEGALGAGSDALIRLERLSDCTPRAQRIAAIGNLTTSAVLLIAPTVLLAVPWIIHAWQELLQPDGTQRKSSGSNSAIGMMRTRGRRSLKAATSYSRS